MNNKEDDEESNPNDNSFQRFMSPTTGSYNLRNSSFRSNAAVFGLSFSSEEDEREKAGKSGENLTEVSTAEVQKPQEKVKRNFPNIIRSKMNFWKTSRQTAFKKSRSRKRNESGDSYGKDKKRARTQSEKSEKTTLIDSDGQSVASQDTLMNRHEKALEEEKKASKAALRLAHLTLFVNVLLMCAKVTASVLSGSMSIISSMVDSLVDITSGLVLSISGRMIKKRDPYLYPRGRTRLQPLSSILISVIMGMASVQLIMSSVNRIYDAIMYFEFNEGKKPHIEVNLISVVIMTATIAVKLTLFLICQKFKSDPTIEVLAMDHRNDCVSNSVALLCGWLGTNYWYYSDPIGAILVSLYILKTWIKTAKEHIVMLSGKSAKPEFINRIIKVCIDHDARITHLDTVYVYHFGTKFLVEVHIVLDKSMALKDAHDISETLQINIESLPDVERAFVHTDYDFSHHPNDEHKLV